MLSSNARREDLSQYEVLAAKLIRSLPNWIDVTLKQEAGLAILELVTLARALQVGSKPSPMVGEARTQARLQAA